MLRMRTKGRRERGEVRPVIPSRLLRCAAAAGILLVASPAFAGTDAMDALNLVRENGCNGGAGIGVPLVRHPELDRAARALSEGDSLGEAIEAAGYLAKAAHSLYLRNAVGRAPIASVLSRKYCSIVTDPGLEDAGTYAEATETWIVLARRLVPDTAGEPAAATDMLFALVNAARAEARVCGRKRFGAAPPLSRDPALDSAAKRQAGDLAVSGELSHRGADGSMPGERVTASGYRWAEVAENVAADQTDASAVVATWLASPGHCAALMDPRYSDTGLALASGEEHGHGLYWVQVYAAPR